MTVETSLFQALQQATSELHERTLDHPMVQGIGNGSLPEATFRFYIEQDFQFLLRYIRVLANAAASSRDLETMAGLSRMVTATIEIEIDALRDLYVRFGGNRANLDTISRAPTCEAYTNHLTATALERNLLVTLSAILPCHWGYHDIGLHLKRGGLPKDERYAAWIEEYASDEYGEIVDWALKLFDWLGASASTRDLAECQRVWELSSRYEYAFWEMAWNQETWQFPA